MPRDYNFWVYIVTNRNHSVLYIGVTNSLSRWPRGFGRAGSPLHAASRVGPTARTGVLALPLHEPKLA